MRIVIAALFTFTTTAAHADWQYVKWGASAQSVVAASRGELSTNTADAKCISSNQTPLAYAPSKEIEQVKFQVIVCANPNSGTANSVSLRPYSFQTADGVLIFYPLSRALIGKYGQPAMKTQTSMQWKTKDSTIYLDDMGRIEYRRVSSGL